LFDFTGTPEVFWLDPDSGYTADFEWMPYTFPRLAVGDVNCFASFDAVQLWKFLGFASAVGSWASLSYWFQKNKDKGIEIPSEGADRFDEPCAFCSCGKSLYMHTEDWCFTTERINDFCEEFGEDGEHERCSDPTVDDQRKNQIIAEKLGDCWRSQQLKEVSDVARDYVEPGWWKYIPWLN
jgi:hypothetical protein